MARVGGVHVSEHQFGGGSGEIVFEFRGDERSAARLRVQFIKLRFRSGAEHVTHANRPNAPRYARERDVFDIEPAIEEEGKPWPELIDWNAARGEHFGVGESVRKRVSGLL